jgi:hypothetical protein
MYVPIKLPLIGRELQNGLHTFLFPELPHKHILRSCQKTT